MNRAQSLELGVWMNAWAGAQQTSLLRGVGGQLKKLEAVQRESLAVQERLAEAAGLQSKQLEGIQLTQHEILALQRQQLDLQTKDRAERDEQTALKQLVFELQMAIERIDALADQLAQHLLYRGLREQLGALKLTPDRLNEIADKRACHDVIQAVEARVNQSSGRLTATQQQEVAAFLDDADRYARLRAFDGSQLARLEAEGVAHPMRDLTAAPAIVLPPKQPAKMWVIAGAAGSIVGAIAGSVIGEGLGTAIVLLAVLTGWVGAPVMAVRARWQAHKASRSAVDQEQWRSLVALRSKLDDAKAQMTGFEVEELRTPARALPRYAGPLQAFGSRHPDVQPLVAAITAG